jgi:oxygen-independent coproporphyrinogen-3 oxidase
MLDGMSEQIIFGEELARRMSAPQRHRLLQGYPMVPLMRAATNPDAYEMRELDGRLETWRHGGRVLQTGELEPPFLSLDPARPLIIGIIPHTQCNPRVRGCGFCTFGQDRYSKDELKDSVGGVANDIEQLLKRRPQLGARRVTAVYFGGGTANLTPPDALRELAATLARCFDLRSAEVTIEGVPSLFRKLGYGPLDVLREMPARHRRISMGVQTFDAAQIARMGRERFGDRRTIARVIDKAHRYGFTASGDFLFNLPFQSRAQMLDDLRIGDELGLDQICIYHLVLHEEQGTPWAKDAALLAALPPVAEALDNWLALREFLLARGFVQTTLTNFERATVNASERRFIYEEHSFTPQTFDALGFGPLSITTVTNLAERRALKFLRSRQPHFGAPGFNRNDLYFPYVESDLELLFVTRSLPRLRIDRQTYRATFGCDLVDAFAGPVTAIVDAGLARLDDGALVLAPTGMFYADSVAGLLAARRAGELREAAAGRHTRDLLHETIHGPMG